MYKEMYFHTYPLNSLNISVDLKHKKRLISRKSNAIFHGDTDNLTVAIK